jgi:orotate phosphoribosyltransferase
MTDDLARHLWNLNAIHINFDTPFRTPHTRPTPIFVDSRRIFFEPPVRQDFVQALANLIAEATGGHGVDVVASDETAGIPLGAWLAERLTAHFVYIRKSAKSHGLPNLIEGGPVAGRAVALVTDLVHVGETLVPGIANIQSNGATLLGVFAVVGRAPFADYQPYAQFGVRLNYLLHLTDIIETGFNLGRIGDLERKRLLIYLGESKQDPAYRQGSGPLRDTQ